MEELARHELLRVICICANLHDTLLSYMPINTHLPHLPAGDGWVGIQCGGNHTVSAVPNPLEHLHGGQEQGATYCILGKAAQPQSQPMIATCVQE